MTSQFVATPQDGVAWVSGASSGIGRALCLALAGAGWQVAATARSADKLETLVVEAADLPGAIHSYPGDVTDKDQMATVAAELASRFGALGLVVANAGVYLPQDGLASAVEDWRKSIDVNLMGVVHVVLSAIERMKAAGKGQIAIVSSLAGYRGLPTSSAYGATKAALINMAEALKFDLDPVGIRMQLISPGFVDTPATAGNPFPMPDLISPEQAADEIMEGLRQPKGFEIAFPRGFVRRFKILRLLPYGLYFKLVAKATGWDKR